MGLQDRCAAICLLLAAASGAFPAGAQSRPFPVVLLPPVGLRAEQVAIIVNDQDPLSVRIAKYYAARRSIADDHVVHVAFREGRETLDRKDFARIKADVDARLPADVEALVLTWARPYRVECMSVTMAFAAGFDEAHCANGCEPTKRSPYFDADTVTPARDLAIRPTMMLAAPDFASAKALIDRGVRSDGRWPEGKAYLLDTPDAARNVRASGYAATTRFLSGAYPIAVVRAAALVDQRDVMFYFTGVGRVAHLDRVTFLDGALADHLTSNGGMLTDSPQMSSLEWLGAGATGSYGAVVEPCNFLEKFPRPVIVMGRYLMGETLLEAYWKSVAMPGQGVFIGEPLARPFGGTRLSWQGDDLVVESRAIRPGRYVLEESGSLFGAFRPVAHGQFLGAGVRQLRIVRARADHTYRLVRDVDPPRAEGFPPLLARTDRGPRTGDDASSVDRRALTE